MTYDNACLAHAARVNIDYTGACGEVSACSNNTHCADGRYCAKDGCDSIIGFCEAVPTACLAIVDPVCGCDEVTYDNACLAAQAGVNVDYEGECDAGIQACATNDDCLEGDYCPDREL